MNRKFFGIILSFVFLISAFIFSEIASAVNITTIKNIEPSSALVGDTVIINGENFTETNGKPLVTSVFFGPIDAGGFFTIDSPKKITVIVPKGAKTNTVTLTTKSGEVSSLAKFVVKPTPVINISISSVDSTSVIFKASGLENGKNYNFSLYDVTVSESDRKLAEEKSIPVDLENPGDDVSVTFSNLLPSTKYMGEIKTLFASYSVKFETPFNTKNLNDLISQALEILYSAKEGTKEGEYKAGSIALFDKAIKDAEYINKDITSVRKTDVDNAIVRLQYAIDTFELSKITATNKGTSKNNNNKDPDIALMENGGIVPRCNVGGINMQTGQYNVPCDFNFFIDLINRVIKFLLFVIATPLVAIILMYTGYLYISAGGNSGQVEKVKHILFNAVIGYVIALAAWLIVNTIVTSLNIDPSINTFMDKIQK